MPRLYYERYKIMDFCIIIFIIIISIIMNDNLYSAVKYESTLRPPTEHERKQRR